MSLRVHIAATEAEAERDHPIFSIDEIAHAQTFHRGTDLTSYLLLWRMRDYYADAIYPPHELPALIEELTEVIPKFRPNTSAAKALQQFLAACRTALRDNQLVICFCD